MYLYTGRPSRSHRFHSIKYFSERCCKVKLTLCLSTVNLFSSSRIRMHMSEVSLSAQNDIRRYLRTHTSDVFAEQIRSRLSSGVHHELVVGVRARADAWMSLSGVGRCYEKVSSYKWQGDALGGDRPPVKTNPAASRQPTLYTATYVCMYRVQRYVLTARTQLGVWEWALRPDAIYKPSPLGSIDSLPPREDVSTSFASIFYAFHQFYCTVVQL